MASSEHKIIAPYRRSNNMKALVQLTNSFLPFLALCILSFILYPYSVWFSVVLSIPIGLFLLRIFVIQHDCGHGSLFSKKWMNDWTGRFLGITTLTPYFYWKRQHSIHHATTGNLSKRGSGDLFMWTVDEYKKAGLLERAFYRLVRSPFFLFSLVGPLLFIIIQRLPWFVPLTKVKVWYSVMSCNTVIAAIVVLLSWVTNFAQFAIVYLPGICLASVFGTWLFYIQHQFKETYWEWDENWDLDQAGLAGSSFYKLPAFLNWFTGSIGYHHIHHLSSRIPNYELKRCYEENPELSALHTFTLMKALKCSNLALWNEEKRELIRFRDLKHI